MSDYNTKFLSIQKCRVFNQLNEEEIHILANLGEVENYKKGDILFSFEDPGDAFFIIYSGSLKAFLRDNHKKKFKPGQLIGEISMFVGRNRTGSVRVSEKTTLIKFNKVDIYNENFININLQLKITLCLVNNIVDYFYETPMNITELIKKGESETLEFKKEIHKKNIEEILRTVVGMCNHKGGTILIGVNNDGTISGTSFDSDDLMKDIEALAYSRTGNELLSMTHIFFDMIDGNKILRIECEPASNFIFWNEEDKKILFIRSNAVTRKLDNVEDIAKYFHKRYTHM